MSILAKPDDFDDEDIFIMAGGYNKKFNKFIIKVNKKEFESEIMRIVIEVNITENRDKMNDKKLREAIIVSLSIKRCLDGWINKVEELERNAINNTREWDDFCADIILYYSYVNAMYDKVVPIVRH